MHASVRTPPSSAACRHDPHAAVRVPHPVMLPSAFAFAFHPHPHAAVDIRISFMRTYPGIRSHAVMSRFEEGNACPIISLLVRL
jgi:hypothetical protein